MAVRHRTCAHCGEQFSYEIGRGTDRVLCSDACAKEVARQRKDVRAQSYAKCSVEGCDNAATRVSSGLCEKHYCRVRRSGGTDKVDTVKPGMTVHNGGGYLLVYAPAHPLRRGASPRVYQHRQVFYDEHGAGPFNCHVCGAVVTWDDMHVDHLNDVTTDNRIENLAPACAVCNQRRGKHKADRTAKLKRGKHITAHGVTMCEADWSRHLGVSRAAFKYRFARGDSLDEAMRPRVGSSGPNTGRSRVPLRDLFVISDDRDSGDPDWAV